jgi:hypothetical protein
MPGRRGDSPEVVGRQARRADDMDDARLRGERGEFQRGGRRRKIQDAVGLQNGGERLGGNRNAGLAGAGEQSRILSKRGRVRTLQRACENRARGLVDRADQHPPHPSGGAGYNEPHVGHVHPLGAREARPVRRTRFSRAAGRHSLQ